MPGYRDCLVCEFRDNPDLICHCVSARVPSICSYLAGERGDDATREAYRRLVREKTTGETPPPQPPPPRPVIEGRPVQRFEAPTIPLAISIAVMTCSVKGANFPCGCQQAKWYCGNTFDLVTFNDCVTCQQALANEAQTMTNSEAVGILAPAILAVLDEDHLLDPNVEFPFDPAFYPISAETQWQWDHEEPLDPGKVAALKIARYMANVLFPAVE